MVMFRDFTQRNATKLGLMGIVQNIDNGSVRVVAEGKKDKLQELLKLLQKGPIFARVKEVQEKWMEPTDEFSGFKIVYKL